jgi:hypothetical protein
MVAGLKIFADSAISRGNLPVIDTGSSTVTTIMGIVFGIAGALALLMITVSGLRYITSAGNPEKTSKAKNGIIYALVGLVIAISAEAIVAYVANHLQAS